MTMRIIPDPSEEERGCYRLFTEIDGERLDAAISEVALLELGCREGDDLAAFVAQHQETLEDLVRAARAKRPGPPVRVWADDVRRREAAAAGGLGGAPAAWK
jgi:hypothetical protein